LGDIGFLEEAHEEPVRDDADKFRAEPPDERNEFYAYYGLRGDFNPDDITARTGIIPTDVRRIGEPMPHRAGRAWDQSKWSLYSKLARSAAIEEHVDSVLEQLQPAWQSFVELGSEYEAQLECVIQMYEAQGGGVYFSREVVQQAAALNAFIDIDSYCLGGTNDESHRMVTPQP
jgi:Domain of unknown function (DUF4279)